ncbi:MAG: glutathione S-transferase family protein [Myxococcales bacterium]
MSIVLYHHPYSRASGVVWMLEEVGAPYELRFTDITKGDQKKPEFLALNAMGKLPTLQDGDTVVTEAAAIGLYLADRYAYGRLAPKVDDPLRAAYYRWAFFAPSVIEPGALAKLSGWAYRDSNAGWGSYEAMLDTMEKAVSGKEYLLGEMFSMADVIFGGTLRYMLRFKTIEARPAFEAYVERISARPAARRADEVNNRAREENGVA